MTAAEKSFCLPQFVKVTNQNNKSKSNKSKSNNQKVTIKK